jgi:uncharacterized protein (TIGR04255 family)
MKKIAALRCCGTTKICISSPHRTICAPWNPKRGLSSSAMSEDIIPEREDLPNKPLVEAIFELQWELLTNDDVQRDPGFRILLGRMYDKVRSEYPELEDLPQTIVPEDITPRIVRHRFRVKKNGWPLVQIGPGILSVNDTEGYTWEGFKPRLIEAITALFGSYPTDIHKLNVTQVTFRYLDAIPYDGSVPVLQFLRELMHTNIQVDPLLFEEKALADSPIGLQLSLAYALPDLRGDVAISLSLGARDGKPSIIWGTQVRAQGNNVPKSPKEYGPWLEAAHTVLGNWFRTLARGKLYESFRGKK